MSGAIKHMKRSHKSHSNKSGNNNGMVFNRFRHNAAVSQDYKKSHKRQGVLARTIGQIGTAVKSLFHKKQDK